MQTRTMVIGWDSSDFNLIRPWAKEGYLPNLNKLLGISKNGNLKSVYPPMTPIAWSTIVTGRNAGKHSIGGFMGFRPNSYDLYPVSAANRQGKDVWELLSEAGKKVAVVGVPLTFPVRKINGCMISGFLTPDGTGDYCYPRHLKDEIASKIPGYTPSPSYLSGEFTAGNDREYIKMLFDILEKHIEGMLYIAENKEWDFFMGVFNESDWIQHRFWACIDENHPKYDRGKAERFGDVIRNVHIRLDKALGELLEIGKSANILVISDHGAGPLHRNVNINYALYKMGKLRFKRTPASRTRLTLARMGLNAPNMVKVMRKFQSPTRADYGEHHEPTHTVQSTVRNDRGSVYNWGRKVVKRLLISADDIDWTRSSAYAIPAGDGQIFINKTGRFPDGTVSESDYAATRSELINNLQELKVNNFNVVEEIFTREELYHGRHIQELADIQLHLTKGYFALGGFDFGFQGMFIDPQTAFGIHSMNGIFLLSEKGYDFSSRTVEDAQLMDIAPTILHLMQVPIPSDLDGKSLADNKLKPPIKESLDQSPISETPVGYTKEEEADIEDRLRSLGYI